MFDLVGKTALITGASSGLGRHFAQLLSHHGARVAIAARRVDNLQTLAAEIKAAGGTAYPIAMDVTSEDSVKSAVAAIAAELGGIDILVNNSGVSGTKPALESSGDDWDYVLNTNLRGAFLVAREAARVMQAGGTGGSIVNIASIVGLRPVSALAAYAASKAGLIHLTHSLGLELARFKIRVNAIAPGYFRTDINDAFWETEPGKAMIKRIPQRRLGNLADLDGPLLLLASDAGRYMTGAVIPVDGGHLVSPL